MIKKTNIEILLLFGVVLSFLFIENLNRPDFAVAQTIETIDPNAETIKDFDKMEINNTAIIRNDTAISNPNNTLLDTTEVNIEEDCTVLADGSKYCP